jgi:hypothetical protein
MVCRRSPDGVISPPPVAFPPAMGAGASSWKDSAGTIKQSPTTPKKGRESVALETQVAVAQRISRLAGDMASYRVQRTSMTDRKLAIPATDSLRRGLIPPHYEERNNKRQTHVRTGRRLVAASAPQNSAVTRCKWHRENCVKGEEGTQGAHEADILSFMSSRWNNDN